MNHLFLAVHGEHDRGRNSLNNTGRNAVYTLARAVQETLKNETVPLTIWSAPANYALESAKIIGTMTRTYSEIQPLPELGQDDMGLHAVRPTIDLARLDQRVKEVIQQNPPENFLIMTYLDILMSLGQRLEPHLAFLPLLSEQSVSLESTVVLPGEALHFNFRDRSHRVLPYY